MNSIKITQNSPPVNTKSNRPKGWELQRYWEDTEHYWHLVADVNDNPDNGLIPDWVYERRGLPLPKQKIELYCNGSFDDFDVYLLAYTYDLDLRAEIKAANIKASLSQTFGDDSFPWADYSKACRFALNCKLATANKASKAKLPSKHIDIEAIKAQNDIVSVIERYTTLKKSGHNRFTGRCPLHNDRGPSLTVYADSQSWHCFGACNKGGDIFDFIMAANACDFKQAVTALGGR